MKLEKWSCVLDRSRGCFPAHQGHQWQFIKLWNYPRDTIHWVSCMACNIHIHTHYQKLNLKAFNIYTIRIIFNGTIPLLESLLQMLVIYVSHLDPMLHYNLVLNMSASRIDLFFTFIYIYLFQVINITPRQGELVQEPDTAEGLYSVAVWRGDYALMSKRQIHLSSFWFTLPWRYSLRADIYTLLFIHSA